MPDLNNEFGLDIYPNLDRASVRRAESEARRLSINLKKMLGMIGISFSAAGLISFGKQAAAVAAEVEKTKKQIQAAFSDIDESGRRLSSSTADSIDRWAGSMSKSLGRSENDLRNYALSFSDLAQDLNLTKKAAAGFSTEMVKLALDIGEFNGMSDSEAISKLSAALQGSESAAKDLNVTLDDTHLKEAMLQMGLKGTFNALDEGQKATVRYNAIVAQSQGALEGMGAAAEALKNGDYAAWQTNLTAKLKDFKALVGTYILPYLTEAAKLGVKILDYLTGGIEKTGKLNDRGARAKEIFGRIERILRYIVDTGKRVIDFVGGTDNALEILLATLGAFAAMKIVDTIDKIGGAFEALGAAGGGALLPFLLLYLAIDDLFTFARGGESLFGDILTQAGVDVEAFREQVESVIQFAQNKIDAFRKFLHLQPLFEKTDENGDPVLDENGKPAADLSDSGVAKTLFTVGEGLIGGKIIKKVAGAVARITGKLIGGGAAGGAAGAGGATTAAGGTGGAGGLLGNIPIPGVLGFLGSMAGFHYAMNYKNEDMGGKSLVEAISEGERNLLNEYGSYSGIAKGLSSELVEELADGLSVIGTYIKETTIDPFVEGIKKELETPVEMVAQAVGEAKEFVGATAETVKEATGYNDFVGAREGIAQTPALIEETGDNIAQTAQSIYQNTQELASTIIESGETLTESVNELAETTRNGVNDLNNAFAETGNIFAHFGDPNWVYKPGTDGQLYWYKREEYEAYQNAYSGGQTYQKVNNLGADYGKVISYLMSNGERSSVLGAVNEGSAVMQSAKEYRVVTEPEVHQNISFSNTFNVQDEQTAFMASRKMSSQLKDGTARAARVLATGH